MSGGTFDERDPCAERGSFDLRDEERAGAGSGPGVRTFPDWWAGRFHAFIGACTSCLVERIGERHTRAVVLSGSFALDEGSVLFTGSGPLFLSDIDLIVVTDSREVHASVYENRRQLGAACEALFPGAVFSGRVEIGVFIADELRRLPPRPGALDLREHGIVLWGDEEVLSLVPEHGKSEIGGEEALLLLENRMLSLLGKYPGASGAVRDVDAPFWYEIARVYTDIATAALCLARSYRPGYEERARAVEGQAGTGLLDRFVPRSLVPLIVLWTAFKLDPTEGSRRPEIGRGTPLRQWAEAAGAALETWKRGAVHLLGCAERVGDLPRAASLIRLRAKGGGAIDNVRFWRTYLSRMPLAGRVRTVASLGGTLLRMSPLDAIRYDGVRLIEDHARYGAGSPAPPLALVAAGERRSWETAAAAAHRMWAEIVFGGKDT